LQRSGLKYECAVRANIVLFDCIHGVGLLKTLGLKASKSRAMALSAIKRVKNTHAFQAWVLDF